MMTKSSCFAAAMHGRPYFLQSHSSHSCEHRIYAYYTMHRIIPVHRMVQLCNFDSKEWQHHMPGVVWCNRTWAVSSDMIPVVAFLGVIINLPWCGHTTAEAPLF